MSELVLFKDVIYAFRDVPLQYIEHFSNQFSFVGAGTAQRQFVTKVSVEHWLEQFDQNSLSRFRDLAFLKRIIESESEYILKDGMLYFQGVLLHQEIFSKDQLLDTYKYYSDLYQQIMTAFDELPANHESNAAEVKARIIRDFNAMRLQYETFQRWQQSPVAELVADC
jgi:hypothetical protein